MPGTWCRARATSQEQQRASSVKVAPAMSAKCRVYKASSRSPEVYLLAELGPLVSIIAVNLPPDFPLFLEKEEKEEKQKTNLTEGTKSGSKQDQENQERNKMQEQKSGKIGQFRTKRASILTALRGVNKYGYQVGRT